tara:strand:+ start:28333 stop:28605 length:273 start_codon:yes stop_codon:yes gene_type:complete
VVQLPVHNARYTERKKPFQRFDDLCISFRVSQRCDPVNQLIAQTWWTFGQNIQQRAGYEGIQGDIANGQGEQIRGALDSNGHVVETVRRV